MPEYPPGTPCWVDVSSPDPDASASFYGELLGWEAEDAGPGTGGYRLFRVGGLTVAGLAPAQPDQPPAWTTYVMVEDAAATVAKVEAAGGRTLLAPMEVADAGRMAIFVDGADGAVFGVWEPAKHHGAGLVNAPGALTMNELDTRDFGGAGRFYGGLFGWGVEPIEADGKVVYASFKLDGRLVASMLPMGPEFAPQVPANWVPYFGVDDLEASGERAASLGGELLMGPTPVPAGRFSVLRDPHGAVFCIWEGNYDPPPGA